LMGPSISHIIPGQRGIRALGPATGEHFRRWIEVQLHFERTASAYAISYWADQSWAETGLSV
jgi:hypothetical protein